MVEDFTTGTIHNQPAHRQASLGREWDSRVHAFVQQFGCKDAPELVEEMIVTALKMARDEMSVADLKLVSRSMKELRYSAKVFSQYRAFRKIAIFGSARSAPDSPEALVAEEFSRRMIAEKFMLITGGGEGIMGAAQKGAGREMSFGLNIRLPFEQAANETIEGDKKLINFNYFFTRKLTFVKETHAFALFPGGFGTLDESFEALTLIQTGKARIIPVVMLDKPGGTYWDEWLKFVTDDLLGRGLISPEDFSFFKILHTVDEAVAEIVDFYRVYHSARWVLDQLVLRLQRGLRDDEIASLQGQFGDMLRRGKFEQSAALPAERSEPEIANLSRLVFAPFRRDFGRYRQLIDAINRFGSSPA